MENIDLKAMNKGYYDKKNGPFFFLPKFVASEGGPMDFYGKTKGEVEVQIKLWNSFLLKETNDIWKHIEETEKIDSHTKDPVKNIENISYLSRKTSTIWNEDFQRFRFFENNVYYITLAKSNFLDATSVHYEQWSAESFAKEMSHFFYYFWRELNRKGKIKKYLYPLVAIGGWIVIVAAVYYIAKFFN